MPILEINDHKMYFEVHGEGPPALCMGGWGTYCHGNEHHVGKYLLENYQVIIFDHRGLGKSTDNESTPSMSLYAEDCAGLLDHLGISNVSVVGLIGMGACIGQELAIKRPDLVKCLVNMNTWAKPDLLLRHQLETFREVHREMGWEAFQKLVCLWSFEESFYLENANRLLGPKGPWRELIGRFDAHARLIEACLTHDTVSRLENISCPTLIIHCPLDLVNGPRLTIPIEKAIPNAKGVTIDGAAHVIAGRTMREKYAEVLKGFLQELNE